MTSTPSTATTTAATAPAERRTRTPFLTLAGHALGGLLSGVFRALTARLLGD
ncbi:hypothetical protein AB0D49_01470 [Streptomyces sp. NPDC048290]|uniref:hypothetical protein n=1 Tax=Streptomyces sp. NPDC048290 TaxID=3155811 RepID=UPI0034146A0D